MPTIASLAHEDQFCFKRHCQHGWAKYNLKPKLSVAKLGRYIVQNAVYAIFCVLGLQRCFVLPAAEQNRANIINASIFRGVGCIAFKQTTNMVFQRIFFAAVWGDLARSQKIALLCWCPL